MIYRRAIVLVFLWAIVIGMASAHPTRAPGQEQRSQSHIAWVSEALRMQTIKLGMTRTDLLNVFTTEGGLSNGLHRTFVSRDCPYFKVDVEFEAVGRPN